MGDFEEQASYKILKEQALEAMKIMGHDVQPDITRNSGKIAAAFIAADGQRDELFSVLKAVANSPRTGPLPVKVVIQMMDLISRMESRP